MLPCEAAAGKQVLCTPESHSKQCTDLGAQHLPRQHVEVSRCRHGQDHGAWLQVWPDGPAGQVQVQVRVQVQVQV
jgi:hypothetical protein